MQILHDLNAKVRTFLRRIWYNKKLNVYTKTINSFQYLGLKIHLNFDDRGHPRQKNQKKLENHMEIIKVWIQSHIRCEQVLFWQEYNQFVWYYPKIWVGNGELRS